MSLILRVPLCMGMVLAALAAPASADTLKARYAVSLIGLPLGQAQMVGSFDPGKYKLEASTKLTGLVAMVTSLKSAAIGTGTLANGRTLPTSYATTSANSQLTRTVRMGMTAGNVNAVDISPPFNDWPGRVPVTDAHKRNILDPVSALVMPVAAKDPLVGPAACNRKLPIFDAYTRFDVDLTYVGTRQVEAKGYKGPVSVCAARYTPISGHRPEREATKFLANNKQMEIWLAPIEKVHAVIPFRISVMTMVGMTVIEATEFAIEPSSQAALAQ